ncbi:hypothetical protein WDU99_15395 [Microbacterium sp. Mu-80]|uniref:Uncharacterized protein n=1 Tax=Microbacterium bandirmense TaxID=3122050 RepID=A0ABU8LEF1_9MICO
MDTGASRGRIPAVLLWGALTVLVWAAFTALVGGGDARADDDEDKPLSGVSSLLSGVVSEVADPVVEGVVDVVTETTAPVVDAAENVVEKTTKTVSEVPVVGKSASDALSATTQGVSKVTEAVSDVAAESPVSSVVEPVTDAVRDVPVVGTVLDDLGATDLLGDSAGAVDDVVGTLTPIVDETVPPIVDALDPQHPGADTPDAPTGTTPTELTPTAPGADASLILPGTAQEPDAASIAPVASTAGPVFLASLAANTAAVVQTTADATDAEGPAGGAPAPPLATAPASSSAGPGGSAGGVHAAVHHLPVHADGAWTAAGPPVDSALPPSPAGSTDVSPD